MYIKVRVKAAARKEKLEVLKEDHLSISVCEKAERNMANQRVCQLVATYFQISPKSVRIVSGHQSPSKILSIPDTES